jgi:hypothetical protein
MCWRSCGNRSKMVSYEYNFAGILNPNFLKALAVRLLSVRESGRVQ